MQRERVIDRDLHRVTEFSSIADFLKVEEVPAGISTVQSGGLPIDLLVSPTASRTTICFFHGAVEPHFTLPVLSGLGISGGIEANRVFISDPALVLDEQLMLAWYTGNKYQPQLQHDLTRILKKIVEGLGSDKVVFFGGSGGGFASLFFASQFQDSRALVFNPQTNIAKYSERAVRDFAESAFGVTPGVRNPLRQLPGHIVSNLCDLYSKPTTTRVAYIQNLNDKAHTHSHLMPFVAALHPDTEVLLLARRWREGHSPPPKELLSRVLNLAASSEEWSRAFSRFGFRKAISTEL